MQKICKNNAELYGAHGLFCLDKGRKAVIFASCCMFIAVSCYLLPSIPSYYLISICEDTGMDRAAFSALNSVRYGVTGIMSVYMAVWIRRLGLHRILWGGCIFAVLSYLFYTLAESLPMFYLAGALGGVGCLGLGTAVVSLIIMKTFLHNQGLILSIVYMSSSAASALFSPSISRMISQDGWRRGFRVVLIAVLALSILGCIGCQTCLDSGRAVPVKERRKASFGMFRDEYRRRLLLGMLLLFITGLSITPLYMNYATLLNIAGYSAVFAGGIAMSITSASNIAAKLLAGRLTDKGYEKYIGLGLGVLFLTTCVMAVTLNMGWRWCGLPMILVGGTLGTATVLYMPILGRSLFPEELQDSALFFMSSAQNIGAALGFVVFQLPYTYTENYQVSLIGCLLLAVMYIWGAYMIFHEKKEGNYDESERNIGKDPYAGR